VAKQPAQPAPINDNRRERLLAFMVIGTIGLSLLAFFAIILGTAVGAGANNGFSQGIWPTIFILPIIALPIGIVLILVLLILNTVRRSREANGTSKGTGTGASKGPRK
jgi:ABC-type dipeptide/oligopeptide/nickel transport system permease component